MNLKYLGEMWSHKMLYSINVLEIIRLEQDSKFPI